MAKVRQHGAEFSQFVDTVIDGSDNKVTEVDIIFLISEMEESEMTKVAVDGLNYYSGRRHHSIYEPFRDDEMVRGLSPRARFYGPKAKGLDLAVGERKPDVIYRVLDRGHIGIDAFLGKLLSYRALDPEESTSLLRWMHQPVPSDSFFKQLSRLSDQEAEYEQRSREAVGRMHEVRQTLDAERKQREAMTARIMSRNCHITR